MPLYENSTVNLNKLLANNKGYVRPLCNSCATKDCEHYIEPNKVSILGINENWRLLKRNEDKLVVIKCEGHSV